MNVNELKIKALTAIGMQYDYIKILEDCEEQKDNPTYYTAQKNQLAGMREMFEAIFEDSYAPYTRAATHAMIVELSREVCPF